MPDLDRAVSKMFAIGFDGKVVTPSLQKLLDRGVSAVALFSRNVESMTPVYRLEFARDRFACSDALEQLR